MDRAATIGIIGDYDEKKTSHPATNNAIRHAADYLDIKVNAAWLPTPAFLTKNGQKKLGQLTLSGCHRAALTGAWRALSTPSGQRVK